MKKRRGKNGLTKSEYANQEFIAARDRLFDKTMANIAKKKAKVEEGQSGARV